MPDTPTFSEQMLAKIEAVLMESAGLQSATIAGQTVTYADLLKQRDYWQKQVAQEKGERPLMIPVHFGGI
jgi:hypothetical protein